MIQKNTYIPFRAKRTGKVRKVSRFRGLAAKLLCALAVVSGALAFTSCSSGKAVVAHDADISRYKYYIPWNPSGASASMKNIMFEAESGLGKTRLIRVSPDKLPADYKGRTLVMHPKINDGRYVSEGIHLNADEFIVEFADYSTGEAVAEISGELDEHTGYQIQGITKKFQETFGVNPNFQMLKNVDR